MIELNQYLQNHTSLLQRYVLAEDPQAFVKALTLPQEQKLFALLLNPSSTEDAQIGKQLGLSQGARQELKYAKILRQIRKVSTEEQKQELIKKVLQSNTNLTFDFLQPVEVASNSNDQQNKLAESKPNNILETQDTVEGVVLKAFQENPHNFLKLSPYGLKNFPLNKLKTQQEMFFGFLVEKKQILRSLDAEQITNLLSQFIQKAVTNKHSSEEQQFPNEFYEMLTIEQVQLLKKKLPKIFSGYSFYQKNFKLKYQQKLQQYKKPIHELSFEQKQLKRALCLQILSELQKEDSDFSFYFIEKLTQQVLLISQAIADCDIERFINYLKRLRTAQYGHLNHDFKDKIKDVHGKNKYLNKYHEPISCLDSSRVDQNDLINRTIISVFKRNLPNTVEQLSPYISRKHLLKEQAKVKLSMGLQKEIADIHEIFTMNELNELKQKKMLKFLPSNRKVYRVNDKVEFTLTAKNIKTITCKVYTIDLEKQYLQNSGEINQDINLKFLMPISQPLITQLKNDDPFVQERVEIKPEILDNQLGLFIVDLEGEGLSSRAIIRKGTIIVKNKVISAGHELTFYNENGQKIPSLTIWRDGKRIEVKGSYIIPFGSVGSENIVSVYKNYAQKDTISIMQQNYSLSVDYVFHSESFIVGQKAKIILRPELRLANERISVERLNKVTLKVTTINNQGISYSITHQNIRFRDSQDYVLELPIKSYLKNINLLLEAQVSKIDKTNQKLLNNKSIVIDLEEDNNNFLDIYLTKNIKDEYILAVKGKNGESIPNAAATFSYQQYGANFSFSKSLTANQEGIFYLGKLAQVKTFTATVNSNGFSSVRTWKLNQFSETISYGGPIFNNSYQLFFQEGDSIVLPVPTHLNQHELVFYHENITLGTTRNCIKELVIESNRLIGKNLAVGRYTLIFLRFQRRIDIEVIRGKKWINDDIISSNNVIYKVDKKLNNLVTLGELKAEIKDDQIQYEIDLITNADKLPSNLRVHVFAKNYIDSQSGQNAVKYGNANYIPNRLQTLTLKESAYFSDKLLSDQTSYVLNRRKQEINAGNNLEKPHIFLKRIEVRGTDTKDEVLRKEGSYQKMSELCRARPMAKCAMMRQMNKCSDMYDDYSNFRLGGAPSITLQRKLNSHNNFFSQAGNLSANLKVIKGIKVPLGYSQLTVHVFSDDTLIKRDYSLPETKTSLINLTHSKISDKGDKEAWTMSRQIYKVNKGSQRQISRNSTWTTVSKSNVIDYAITLGFVLPEWLSFWHTYNQQKKQDTYDKYFSHQLNFFIYRNDQTFFEKVVRPFISNRVRKTFVDLYLLGSQETLSYALPHRLQKLNYFERALLVDALRTNGKVVQAKLLAEALQLPLKNIKQSNEAFKVFFETILNAKKTGQVPPPPPSFAPSLLAYAPPPPAYAAQCAMDRMQLECQQYVEQSYNECARLECQMMDYKEQNRAFVEAQQKYKVGFKQTEKTREFTDTTYNGVTDITTIPSLIQPSLFWAELAKHYSSETFKEDFLSDKFSSFSHQRDFILACSVLSAVPQAEFELANKEGSYEVTAKSSFLVFVREVKALPFKETGNIVLNQRFFDPKNKYYYDQDGTQCQQSVSSFLVLRPYTLQTIITNISGSNLQVQLLIDIPQGSIPLKNHEQTQITNVSLNAYTTITLERQFYFPGQGQFSLYSANASRNSTIIAKARAHPLLEVTNKEVSSQKQSLNNILRSNSDKQVYTYLESKNIFDQNTFNIGLILWKLRNKEFFQNCIAIFKKRNYFNPIVWSFGIYHQNFHVAVEFLENKNRSGLGVGQLDLPVFEYYPYYSSRVHKFADQNKSTIRVKEFKDNYAKFLATATFEGKNKDPIAHLALIYYLILQDRTQQALSLRSRASEKQVKGHQLQYDYIDCFLDMSEGAANDYAIARKISEKYVKYPVPAWRKIFVQVHDALTKNKDEETEESLKSQEATFNTTVINHGTEIKINRPADTKVVVNFYSIDLELYFSQFPFSEIGNFSSVSPSKFLEFNGNAFQVHTLLRKDFQHLGESVVQIYEHRQTSAPKQVSKFLWTNPSIKVKVNEKEGTLKVFYDKKKCSTSYCKVYSRGSNGDKFNRDGYTDIASTFRYALDIKDVQEFSILVLTDKGGSIHRVKPPTTQ